MGDYGRGAKMTNDLVRRIYAEGNLPLINGQHIDGPVLIMRTGEIHWLTWSERFLLFLGLTDAERLERKYRPSLANYTTDGGGK